MANTNTELVVKEFTTEQLKLITDTVAKNATKDELQLFLYRCKNLGLDPLKPGQIYFIKYGSGPGTIVVGIEGFRARAASTGKLAGIKRGALKTTEGKLVGAYAEVYRSDWKECAREEVPLEEYNTGKGNWAKMPETMIKKVAEAAALRMAFPDALGGVYEAAEMDQANQPTVRVSQPPADGSDGVVLTDTELMAKGIIPHGKFAMQQITSIDETQLRAYANYLDLIPDMKKRERTLNENILLDFIANYLCKIETGMFEG